MPKNLSMVFPKLRVDLSACVTIEASLLTSDGETWQLLRKENDIVLIRLSGDGGILSLLFCCLCLPVFLFDLKWLRGYHLGFRGTRNPRLQCSPPSPLGTGTDSVFQR